MVDAPTNGKPVELTRDRFLFELGEMVGNLTLERGRWWGEMLDRDRRIDEECDYPPTGVPVGVDYYKELYEREPVAGRVVEVLPRETWMATPKIVDNAGDGQTLTDFEEAVAELGKSLAPGGGPSWHKELTGSPLWEHLLRLDILSGIGQFGVMLLGFDDGLNLQDPVEGATTLIANSEGQSFHLPDSPLSEEGDVGYEATKWLRRPVPRRKWMRNNRNKGGRGVTPEYEDVPLPALNAAERAQVKAWEDQRRVYDAMRRATVNSAAEGDAEYIARWNKLHLAVVTNAENKFVEKFADLLPGTDRQYYEAGSLGMGMAQAKGASLQGTDQQYMGVQFGPSESPSPTPSKKKRKLLFVRCFDESLVQIVRWEWNVNNPRFGQPVMYRVTLNDPRQIYSGVGLPLATVFVHWTRVHHVPNVDNRQNSEVLSMPRLQQVLNRCIDIRKEHAAAGEGYWQSCFASISLETNPQLGGDVKIDTKGLDQMLHDLRERLRRDIITSGMTAKTLAPQVVDPSPFVATCIESICIKIPCPVPVFKGYEIGEQASENNDQKWNDVLRAREQLLVTPVIVCPLIDRLILVGVLPEPKDGYRVEWPDRDSLTDAGKAALALTITQAVAAFIAGDCEKILPVQAWLVKAFDGYFSLEEVENMMQEAEKKAEKDLEDKQAIADQHGFAPIPPPGFKNPEPEQPQEPPATNAFDYRTDEEIYDEVYNAAVGGEE